MLLIDKSTVYSLDFDEVIYLDKYYSLVISPILMRELLSTLAKEASPKKDWQKTLSILAAKADTFHSYTPANAHQMAITNLFGQELPMNGRVPLPGGHRVRTRDGSYAAVFGEAPEKEIFRRWKNKDFSDAMFSDAKKIRDLDQSVDLHFLQKDLSEKFQYIPKFKTLEELVHWMDQEFIGSMDQDLLITFIATNLVRLDQIPSVVKNWVSKGKPAIQSYCPYALYYYRVNMIYFIGLAGNLISPSKKAKTHLDIQYIYYLPFSHCFASNDDFLLDISKFFQRNDQTIINGWNLKDDLRNIIKFFENEPGSENPRAHSFGTYPPDLPNSITSKLWGNRMRPKANKVKKTNDAKPDKTLTRMFRTLDDAVDVNTNQTLKPRKSEFVSMSLIDRQRYFMNKVNEITKINDVEDWDEIRRTLNHDHVYEIYDLHASIWHPDDNLNVLVTQFLDETRSRKKFLHLGDIYQEDVFEDINRWSLYFDQILIIDPFHTPWSKKQKYNPLNDPQIYLRDTLKLVYFLTLVSPLIESGKLVLIPNISSFNPTLNERFYRLAESKELTPEQEQAVVSSSKLNKRKIDEIIRLIASQPETKREYIAKSFFKETYNPVILKLARTAREEDPICIGRDIELKDFMVARTGAMLEEALYLCAKFEAIPFSSLKVRTIQFSQLSDSISAISSTLSSIFKEVKSLKFVEPLIIAAMTGTDIFHEFQELLAMISHGERFDELEKEIQPIQDITQACIDELAELQGEKFNMNGADLIISRSWEVLFNKNGFSTPEVLNLIEEIEPGLSKKLPKLYIGLPEEEPIN